MKARLLAAAIACGVAFFAPAYAQSGGKSGDRKNSGGKAAQDPALEEFYKALGDRSGKFDQARFQKVIATGFAFLVKDPTSARAPAVARDLGTFAGTIDKANAAMRPVYIAQLKYEVINQRGKAGTPEAKTAIAAVDAALLDFETRAAFSRENVSDLREKIDALAAMPGASRFLIVAERSYADILLTRGRPGAGEAHLTKLLDHPDKDLAALAREDLNFAEVGKTPFAAKFTALDGKECDLAQMRGKVLAIVYFRSADEASARMFERWKAFQAEHRKRGFEIVAVSYDAASDREKLKKWVADKKVAWPVYFDGKAAEGEFAPKLGVRKAPAAVLFDQKGMLFATNVPPDRFEPAVRQMLGIKEPAPEPQNMNSGGGGGGGGNRRR